MKLKHNIKALLIIYVTFYYGRFNAQNQLPDTIYWDNGYATLSASLKNVWIYKNDGSVIKNVRLKEIHSNKAKIVYEKEKCLHDLYIFNINRIQAGKNSVYALFFGNANVPVIKMFALRPDPLADYTEFPSFKIPAKNIAKPESKTTIKNVRDSISIGMQTKKTCSDSLIDLQWEIILINIIEMAPETIRFKKQSNPNGPTYVLPSGNIEIKKRKNNITIIQISN